MLAVADSICYHTFIRHPEDNHLYLLGADALFRVQLIELNEQLDSLIERLVNLLGIRVGDLFQNTKIDSKMWQNKSKNSGIIIYYKNRLFFLIFFSAPIFVLL